MKPLLPLMMLCVVNFVCAQEKPLSTASVGVSMGHYFYDPGVMVSVTTPYFNNGRFALRFQGGIRWSEVYFAEHNHFARYSSAQVGMVCVLLQQERLRCYSETGLNLVLPNQVFSEKKKVLGCHGALGTEVPVYTTERSGIVYFFELGLTLNPARAEKLEQKPLYAYGFMPVTGFRFHL